MPLIEIKVFKDEFSDEQRAGINEAVTDTMASFTGESIRPHTWVVLEDVKSWGIGGPSACPTCAPCRPQHPPAQPRHRARAEGRDMNPSARARPRRVYNPVQRDAATFLETSEEAGGERTLVELEVAPGGKVTPHYHLTYSECFTILDGRLILEIDGVRQELGAGDEAVAAPGSLHAWSNPGKERSVARVELRPGSPGFENALRVVYGLAADGLVLKSGVPRNPLHAALVLEMGGVRLPGAYAALERILGMLARLGRWRGVDRELERRYL